MKNPILPLAAVLMAGAMSLVSCDSDSPYVPNPDAPARSNGAYVLTQGNFSHVPGALYAVDYATSSVTAEAFQKANGISLGDSPQCGVCYGSKLYLGVSESNCIFVCDKNTFKVINTIRLNNSKNGQKPRSMVATGGKVYVAMYDGYVVRMDTTSTVIEKSVKVGPNPELMGLYENKLYVPNSDGENYPNYGTTASVIDLDSFSVTATITVPMNPYQFEANNTGLYLLAKGNYSDVTSKIYKMEGIDFKEVADATIMTLDKDLIYYVNAPFYGDRATEYKVYNPANKQSKVLSFPDVQYPSNMVVDRVAGKLFVSSYVMDGQYPSYVAPGYLNEYDMNLNLLHKYDIGAGPTCIFFNQD